MANPTMVLGGTTRTFRPGCIQATRNCDGNRQRKLVSSDGTVRIIEVSNVDDRFIEILVNQLPRVDEGSYHGRDSLRTFLVTTVNWAETTFTFTDADGDQFTVRYWDKEFDLTEGKKDLFGGKLLFRVEV